MSNCIRVINDCIVKSSKFFITHQMTFEQRGLVKKWDYLKVADAVSIMIYHKTDRNFVLIKQFRPPIYANATNTERNENKECGVCYEMCAGLLDKKGLTAKETACIEIFEECGYKVTPERLRDISYGSVGISGRKMYSYYVEVDESDKKGSGGGNKSEGEMIDQFLLPETQVDSFLFDDTKPKTPLMFQAFYWWKYMMNTKSKQ
ncbi:hypothetical protein WA158_001925 [Blastocystis sp. Blastoise]